MIAFQRMLMSVTPAVALALVAAVSQGAEPPRKTPVIVDTDIGSYADDPFALGVLLASPECDLCGITTVGSQADDRAWLVCRFLTQSGRSGVPVAAGAEPQPKSEFDWQIQYRRHPAAIFNRTLKPVARPAHEVLHELLTRHEKTTLLALGPLTNFARTLKEHPEDAGRIERIVMMGGALRVGYSGKPPAEPEWNIKLDTAAAKQVFAAGVPLTVVPLDATVPVKLTAEWRARLFGISTPVAYQLQNLLELWETEDNPAPATLYDLAAAAAVLDRPVFRFENRRLEVRDDGSTVAVDGPANCRVATSVDDEALLTWTIDRLKSYGPPVHPRPAGNRAEPVQRGAFPVRVHAFEDFETDIEKRWWMCGKIETKDVPPGSRRACRAVLTQDFDDLQGDMKAMYRAVIFNPVPGPPMGPRTRLSFRYKLQGTDELRIQLYSLTNGYHRCLSLAGLPENQWRETAVDMTRLHRPDGSGGPLAADERIDDIQFYVDPRAELLIDDIVLYEAAAEDETRPFPGRILFTGWFDTGKQGQEWPGKFEIVPHEKPRSWKHARSVRDPDSGQTWLCLSLRGERQLGERTALSFLHRLTGTESVRIELVNKGKPLLGQDLKPSVSAEWSRSTVTFRPERLPQSVDEVRFLLREGALQIDEVLLYVP